jgi:LysM repeat protein
VSKTCNTIQHLAFTATTTINMNNQSPLIPQGSLLEQKNQGRLRVKIAVFLVLAVHGVGLMALLMAGCQKDKDSGASLTATNNPVPAFQPPTNQPLETNAVPPPATNVAPAPEPPAPQTNAAVTPPTPVPATPAANDYKIAKGDSFSSLAKKFHVGVRAIEEANPGVQPTKLKVGQTIHIPASVGSETISTTGAPATAADTSGEQTYVVKSGDTLTKIATEFGTSVKSLRSANPNLKTTKIKVGQKLKVPAKGTAPSVSTAATTEPPATNPTPSTPGTSAPR